MSSSSEVWICPSCAAGNATAHCGQCGEARPGERHLSLREFLVDVFHALTDIDGRLLRSFRTLLAEPGELTVAYERGRRVPYIGPLQIFLIANVLFYVMQAFTHNSVFASSLDSHLHEQDWSALAQALVARRLSALGTDLPTFATAFDTAAVRNAKALVVLMVLPFALLLAAFFPRRDHGLVARSVFALHLYAFLMLLFSLALGVAQLNVLAGGSGVHAPLVDNVLSVVLLAACIAYLYLATGRVYPSGRSARLAKSAGLGIIVACIVVGYRFAIFVITLYTTSLR